MGAWARQAYERNFSDISDDDDDDGDNGHIADGDDDKGPVDDEGVDATMVRVGSSDERTKWLDPSTLVCTWTLMLMLNHRVSF